MRHETEAMNTAALILPGIGNSGPDHWQSRWEMANPLFVRIQQRDRDHPVCNEWVEVLENTLAPVGANVVLVAHSLACALVAHWAEKQNSLLRVRCWLLHLIPTALTSQKKRLGFHLCP